MEPPDRMIGRRIGRYRIDAEIGRGGMGVVYRATQLSLDRTVAIKMLPPHLAASGEYLARFRREAETLARLAHEDIVHIYDIEEDDEGSHFIIMEHVDGPSLSSLLAREGRFDASRARDVAVVLANALAVAHRKGIVHRDLKPDNILFTSAGRPKLTDFGIAHMRDDRKFRTHTGIMLGTPYYLSPEQALGKPVTPASDLYSLGVVLYEMLCGRPPFDGGDALAVALQHVREAPVPVAVVMPGTPAALCEVVERALRKTPGDRFDSAEGMQRALMALELGVVPGGALSTELPAPGEVTRTSSCPECGAHLAHDFLSCPMCGLSIRRACTRCGSLYDPVAPSCPICKTPSPARALQPRPAASARSAERIVPLAGEAAGAGASGRRGSAERLAHGARGAAARLGPLIHGAAARIAPAARSGTAAIEEALVGVRRLVGETPIGRGAPGFWLGAALLATALVLALLYALPVGEQGAADGAAPGGAASASGGSASRGSAFAGGGGLGVGDRMPSAGRRGSDESLDLSRTLLVFRATDEREPARQPVRVTGDDLTWRAAADAPWVTVEPAFGRTPATLSVGVDPAALEPGDHIARVTVSAGSAGRRTLVVRFESTAEEAPEDAPPPSGVDTPEDAAAADGRPGARAEIEGILGRYRRATETGRFETMRADLSDEVARKWESGFRRFHERADDVTIELAGVTIGVDSEAEARVSFRAVIEGVDRDEGERKRFFSGDVRWRLLRQTGRWVVAWSSI